MVRIDDRAVRGLIVDLMSQTALGTPDAAAPARERTPAPWQERLENMLIVLDERERQARLNDLKRVHWTRPIHTPTRTRIVP